MKVEFRIHGDMHSRLRDVELVLTIQEDVRVDYQRSSYHNGSHHTTRHTAREIYTHASNFIELQKDAAIMGYTLELKIPMNIPFLLHFNGRDLDIDVIAIAEIKFDVSLARDKHITEHIRINIPSTETPRPVVDGMQGLEVSLTNNLVSTNDYLQINFQPSGDFHEKFSKIRIELEQSVSGSAQSHSERNVNRLEVLATFDNLPQGIIQVLIPGNGISSTQGIGFVIEHAIKIVFDKRMSQDINLILPVIYSQIPR